VLLKNATAVETEDDDFAHPTATDFEGILRLGFRDRWMVTRRFTTSRRGCASSCRLSCGSTDHGSQQLLCTAVSAQSMEQHRSSSSGSSMQQTNHGKVRPKNRPTAAVYPCRTIYSRRYSRLPSFCWRRFPSSLTFYYRRHKI
jgi:hypothetical protein